MFSNVFFPFIIKMPASWTLFWWVKKRGGNFLLIYFKKHFLMFLFPFIIGMPASWSWNKWTELYTDKVKKLRRGWNIITALKIIALRYYSKITVL
jgi:hypothetical protein